MSTAIVFSSVNIFSLHLVEFLLTNYCHVYIVSNDHEEWKKQVAHLSHNPNLVIFADNRYLPPAANYVFSVNGIGLDTEKKYTETEIEKEFLWAIDYVKTYDTKAAFVLPYLLANDYEKLTLSVFDRLKTNLPSTSSIVYLGELYGTRMQFLDKGLVTRIIKETIFRGVVTLPDHNQNIFYVFVEDAVKEIVKKLFSFGFSERETVLTESDTVYNFFNNLLAIKPGLSFVKETLHVNHTVDNKNFIVPENRKRDSLRHTLVWLSQYATEPKEVEEVSTRKPEKEAPLIEPIVLTKIEEKKEKKQRNWMFLFVGIFALLFLIASPFISLFVSAAGFKYAYDQVVKGNTTPVKRVALVSSTLATFSRAGLTTFTGMPLLGDFFTFSKDAARSLELSGKVLIQAINLEENTSNIANFVINDDQIDLNSKSSELSKDSMDLYKQITSLNAQINSLPASFKSMLPAESAGKYSEILPGVSKLASRLPFILGQDKQKTYLILIQDNLELRPTGGALKSFALATFEKGKLTDIKVTDIGVADAQLTGKVDMPTSLKNSLGESNFWFKDSNWEPDYPTSAQKAEWFLAKEIDKNVDGVITLDITAIKQLLSVTGPVKIENYDGEIDYKNIYDRVVDSENKKISKDKTFITGLTESLFNSLSSLPSERTSSVLQVFLASLNEKHILVYLHDPASQEAIKTTGWGNVLTKNNCTKANCQIITFGVNEANVGVNNANYLVQRNINIESRVIPGSVQNKLTLNLKNTAAPVIGLEGKYKAYVRLLIENESKLDSVEVVEALGSKFPDPDINSDSDLTQVGTLIELQPGQEKKVVFTWSQPLKVLVNRPGSLGVHLIKQPGTESDPIDLSLTITRPIRYNTNLTEDREFFATW